MSSTASAAASPPRRPRSARRCSPPSHLEELERHLNDPLPRLTEHTITDRAALEADLELIRRRGYAIDLEENTTGLKCFGFALHYNNPAVDAISCSVPLARLTPGREEEIVEAMSAAVAQIERQAPRSGGFDGF